MFHRDPLTEATDLQSSTKHCGCNSCRGHPRKHAFSVFFVSSVVKLLASKTEPVMTQRRVAATKVTSGAEARFLSELLFGRTDGSAPLTTSVRPSEALLPHVAPVGTGFEVHDERHGERVRLFHFGADERAQALHRGAQRF